MAAASGRVLSSSLPGDPNSSPDRRDERGASIAPSQRRAGGGCYLGHTIRLATLAWRRWPAALHGVLRPGSSSADRPRPPRHGRGRPSRSSRAARSDRARRHGAGGRVTHRPRRQPNRRRGRGRGARGGPMLPRVVTVDLAVAAVVVWHGAALGRRHGLGNDR